MIDFKTTDGCDLSLEQRYAWGMGYKRFPAHFFVPTQPQAEFYKAVGELTPETRIFLITSGNGAGKTSGVVNLIYNVIYGNVNQYQDIYDEETGEKYSGFFDYPFFNDFPSDWPHEIWYVSNADSLKTVIKMFRQWGPKNADGTFAVKESKLGKTHVAKLEFPETDWVLYFKTTDQDPGTFESAEISMCIFDEPPPLNLYRAAISRLRAGGIVLLPATPLFSAAWFVDEIIDKVDLDLDKWHQTVSCWSNCIERAGYWDLGRYGMQKKGNLHANNIEFTLRNYDPDERPARESGEFQYLSGLVYRKAYNPDIHYRKVRRTQDPHIFMYRMILDPHDRKPPSVIWVRFDRFGRRSIIREWPSRTDKEWNGKPLYGGQPFHLIKDAGPYTIEDFCDMWIDIEEQLGIPLDRITRIIDPNFGNKINRMTGKVVHEEYSIKSRAVYKRRGYPTNTAFSFINNVVDDLALGHKQVKEVLKPTTDGDIMLEVDKSCFNVNYAFTHYMYDERSAKEHEKHGMTEKVREFAKDYVDLVRYDTMIPFKWEQHKIQDDYEREDYGSKQAQRSLSGGIERPSGAEGA